jgi:hypothetical protein
MLGGVCHHGRLARYRFIGLGMAGLRYDLSIGAFLIPRRFLLYRAPQG